MSAIYKRELAAYLHSPVGYVFLAMFSLLFSILFTVFNMITGSANLSGTFEVMVYVIIILLPILTMRSLSEEKANKTDQLLFTAPVSCGEIVLGKFFAAVSLILLAIVLTLPHLVILIMQGNPPLLQNFVTYIGFFLLACAYVSIGMFISSFTESQVVSAFITFGTFLVLLLLELIVSLFPGNLLATVFSWFSMVSRFQDFSLGLFNAAQVVYYISITAVFLFLTVRRLEKRRWK